MKYALDSNVAFRWEVPEQDTVKALRLRDDFRNGVLESSFPSSELVNERNQWISS